MIVTNRILALLQGKNIPAKTKEELAVKNVTEFKVHVTVTEGEEGEDPTVEAEESFEDVAAAVKSGRPVRAEIDLDGVKIYSPMTAKSESEGEITALTCSVSIDFGDHGSEKEPTLLTLVMSEDGFVVEPVTLSVNSQ